MESNLVRLGIPGLACGLAVVFVLGVDRAERALGTEASLRKRRVAAAALGGAAFLVAIGLAGWSGVLARFDMRPPPMLLWFASVLAAGLVTGLSAFGKRLATGLSFTALVGFQAFRLPLELVMHRAAEEGVMPSVMSFSGYNFDILSGVSALVVGLLLAAGRAPRWLIVAWNALGLALLVSIGTIAMLASPVIRAFGDDQLNLWVTRFPYSFMAVMVAAALLGHVLVARKLLANPEV